MVLVRNGFAEPNPVLHYGRVWRVCGSVRTARARRRRGAINEAPWVDDFAVVTAVHDPRNISISSPAVERRHRLVVTVLHIDGGTDRAGRRHQPAVRNPDDPHTQLVFDAAIRGKTDQFVYRFRKPR